MITKPPVAQDKVSACGIEFVCERITDGRTLTKIAEDIGVSIGSLLTWINAETERSARVKEARMVTARLWDEKATEVIENAPDEFELKRARELAHHYRWRASKIAPKEYGDRLELDGKGMLPVVIIKDLTGRGDESADD